MIQRIQSVYLLVVTILLIVCMCTPVGAYIAEDYTVSKFTNLCIVSADGVKDYAPWAMFIILVVAALLSFTTIFMFKKRMLQIRLCIFNGILMLGFYGLFAFFVWVLKDQLNDAALSVKIALSFPLISLILDYLAIRNIGADEALVRSLDRLR